MQVVGDDNPEEAESLSQLVALQTQDQQISNTTAKVNLVASFHFGFHSGRNCVPPSFGSPHSSTIVTWKFEYKCEMVVSPPRVTTSCNPPSFNGENIDVPETFIVGVGLSSVVFTNVA